MLIGFAIAGKITDAYKLSDTTFDYKTVWIIPAAIAFAVLCLFALFFRDDIKKSVTEADAEQGLSVSSIT
jgi:hypothetical protein